jgi:hypothetical protein
MTWTVHLLDSRNGGFLGHMNLYGFLQIRNLSIGNLNGNFKESRRSRSEQAAQTSNKMIN